MRDDADFSGVEQHRRGDRVDGDVGKKQFNEFKVENAAGGGIGIRLPRAASIVFGGSAPMSRRQKRRRWRRCGRIRECHRPIRRAGSRCRRTAHGAARRSGRKRAKCCAGAAAVQSRDMYDGGRFPFPLPSRLFFSPKSVRQLGHADVKQQRADAKVEQLLGAIPFGDADDAGDRGDVD